MERNNPFIKDRTDFKLTLLTCGKYELECYILDNITNPYLFIINTETGAYNLGSYLFYMVWDTAKEIKEDLLPIIDDVLQRNWGDEVIGNNYTLVDAIINDEKIYFMPYTDDLSDGIEKAQHDESKQLDTKVFREIVLKWLEFLEEFQHK